MNSDELYYLCCNGNEKAWEYLYRYVYQIARYRDWRLGEEEVKDIAQDAMRFLLDGGLKKVKEPKAFKNFIKRMTANRIIDYLRKKKSGRLVPIEGSSENGKGEKTSIPISDPSDFEKQVFTSQVFSICEQILASLKSECQEILSIYFRYKALGRRIKDIAKSLKQPQGTVSSLIHRCLKLLNTHPKMRALRKEVLREVG